MNELVVPIVGEMSDGRLIRGTVTFRHLDSGPILFPDTVSGVLVRVRYIIGGCEQVIDLRDIEPIEGDRPLIIPLVTTGSVVAG